MQTNLDFYYTRRYIPRRRVVHLDLKGAPPKLTYFKNLFPLFASAGATTVLIEYEDMFPFKGDIRVAIISECHDELAKNKIGNICPSKF